VPEAGLRNQGTQTLNISDLAKDAKRHRWGWNLRLPFGTAPPDKLPYKQETGPQYMITGLFNRYSGHGWLSLHKRQIVWQIADCPARTQGKTRQDKTRQDKTRQDHMSSNKPFEYIAEVFRRLWFLDPGADTLQINDIAVRIRAGLLLAIPLYMGLSWNT
jgi:hypothetical protein